MKSVEKKTFSSADEVTDKYKDGKIVYMETGATKLPK
jgi:hypothetical protein